MSQYWIYRTQEVFVDSVIMIGQGGLDRVSANLLGSTSRSSWENLLRPLEPGRELMENLHIKYGFDRPENPRLVRRLPKTQHVVHGSLIRLIVKGDDEKSALSYMNNIVHWIMDRHERIYGRRKLVLDNYIEELKTKKGQALDKCLQLSHGKNTTTCDWESFVRFQELLTRIYFAASPVYTTQTRVVLEPVSR